MTVIHDFSMDIEAYKEATGKKYSEIAKELGISTRYLRQLRKGDRKGVKGKGKYAKHEAEELYESTYNSYIIYSVNNTKSPPFVIFKKKVIKTSNIEDETFKGEYYISLESDYEQRLFNLQEIISIHRKNILNDYEIDQEIENVKPLA